MTKKKLKVAYLTRAEFGVIGGAASYMFPSTVSKHHDVLVLESCARKSLRLEPVVFRNAHIPIVNIYNKKKVARMRNKYEVLRGYKPDIVHVFQSGNCLNDVKLLRQLPTKPIVILDFRTPLYSPKSIRIHFTKLKTFFKSQFYIDWVITHSSLTLRSNLPIRIKRFTEVPPGVELARFSPKKRHRHQPRNFIFIGSLAKTRRLDILIDLFKSAIKSIDHFLKLDIYGQGDAAPDIQKQIESSNLEKNITLKGIVAQNELFKRMPEYDAGIAYVPDKGLGTIFSKAPSLKSLEYAASGIPIVASATIGHKFYQSNYGFEFELFDNHRDGFVNALNNIRKNDATQNMVEQNLSAIKNFDWDHIIKAKLLPTYQCLITNSSRCAYNR